MKKKLIKSKRKGFTALVMIIIAILLVTGVGLLSLGFDSRVMSIRDASGIAARCAADSGLAKAIFEMNEKLKVQPWDGSTLPAATNETLPGSDLIFSYTVTGDSSSGYTVQCTGKYLAAEKTVHCTLGMKGLFDYAIFTKTNISMNNSATVDWYNNDAGDRPFSIGTNAIEAGAIDLKHGATVNGDVIVGYGGDPDVVIEDGGANITGDVYVAPEVYDIPPATVPQGLVDLPSQGTLNDCAVITGSGKYDSIDLGNHEVIVINGDVSLYITGDITLGNSAQLLVVNEGMNPNASLTLYVGGNVEVKNGGAFNNLAQDPKKLSIVGVDDCEDIILKNSTDFYGTIYAPDTRVEMKNSANAYGAVVADTFDQKNSATFYYDASLRDVTVEQAERFVVKYWSEN